MLAGCLQPLEGPFCWTAHYWLFYASALEPLLLSIVRPTCDGQLHPIAAGITLDAASGVHCNTAGKEGQRQWRMNEICCLHAHRNRDSHWVLLQ